MENIQVEIIQDKIKKINEVYKYKLELKLKFGVVLPFELNTITKDGYIICQTVFENLKQVYIYLQGMIAILEI